MDEHYFKKVFIPSILICAAILVVLSVTITALVMRYIHKRNEKRKGLESNDQSSLSDEKSSASTEESTLSEEDMKSSKNGVTASKYTTTKSDQSLLPGIVTSRSNVVAERGKTQSTGVQPVNITKFPSEKEVRDFLKKEFVFDKDNVDRMKFYTSDDVKKERPFGITSMIVKRNNELLLSNGERRKINTLLITVEIGDVDANNSIDNEKTAPFIFTFYEEPNKIPEYGKKEQYLTSEIPDMVYGRHSDLNKELFAKIDTIKPMIEAKLKQFYIDYQKEPNLALQDQVSSDTGAKTKS